MRRLIIAVLGIASLSMSVGCRHVCGYNDCGCDIPICGHCRCDCHGSFIQREVVPPPTGSGKGSGRDLPGSGKGSGSGSGSGKGSGSISLGTLP
jgi:hypothetical protein